MNKSKRQKQLEKLDDLLLRMANSDHRPVLKPEYDKQELPDARRHQLVSSGIRMLGYVFLPFDLTIAMGVLFVSEIVGIIEELV
jgi:hypothetical protein